MTAVELRTHPEDELQQMLNDLKDELFGLKFQQILGQLEDTTVLKKTRKDIARIKTILRERELGIR
ncbi:TPA: 50S ribosomal protein L29 [Candidatus Poribacteria bacterium]|nr:50S ribosomal protein L29 [Candidatus Poribacteria bacterium]